MGTPMIPNRDSGISSILQAAPTLTQLFLGSGKTTGTNTTTKQGLDPAVLKALTDSITSGAYSKDAAGKDAQGAIDANIRTIMEKYLPQIGQSQAGSGAYNSSTTKLLQDDLASRVAGEAAKLKLDTITKYADITNNTAQVAKDANVTKTETSTQQTAPVVDNPMMGILGTGAALLAPTILSGLGKLVLGGLGSGSNSDAPPNGVTWDGTNKKFVDSADPNAGNLVSANLITPTFASMNTSNVSALSDTLTSALGSTKDSVLPDFFGGSGEAKTSYSSPDVLTGLIQGLGNNAAGGGSVTDTLGEAASNVDIGGAISDALSSLTKGCFITTAMCEFYGLADDCEELTILRNFRDTYMQETELRRAQVEHYYKYAPKIVEHFNALIPVVKADLYMFLRDTYILPAVEAIKVGELDYAYQLYKQMFEAVNFRLSMMDIPEDGGEEE